MECAGFPSTMVDSMFESTISDDSELWFRMVEAGRLLPLARISFFGFRLVKFGVFSWISLAGCMLGGSHGYHSGCQV